MKRAEFIQLFGVEKPIIGMVHLRPLPGSPQYDGDLTEVLETAAKEARILEEGGVDGIQIENMWDLPYLKPKNIGPETVASLTVAAFRIAQMVKVPIGINCHLNGAIQSLAIALATSAKWVRVFEWTNSYISNAGLIEAAAPWAQRYRSFIGAKNVRVFADVQVKHGSHFIISDRSIQEQAHDLELCGADAIIVTGTKTGSHPEIDTLKKLYKTMDLPILIGSGLTTENAKELLEMADGAIVGSYFKREGNWKNELDMERVKRFMEIAKKKTL